jgi:glucosamine-6-phosphate deaminase
VEVLRFPDDGALSRAGAELVAGVVRNQPDAVLLLATGNTPLGLYGVLAERVASGTLDLSRVWVVQLDEYVGVTESDPRSLYGWLVRVALKPLRIGSERVVRLRGAPEGETLAACRRFDEAVRALGGIDLAVLGLGPNGHLGFNEPPSSADAPTRRVALTPASLASNALYWAGAEVGEVPREAVTAGMHLLLGARRTLLLVSGAHKRDILRRAVRGPVTPEVPASWLQTVAGVTVLADAAAWPRT